MREASSKDEEPNRAEKERAMAIQSAEEFIKLRIIVIRKTVIFLERIWHLRQRLTKMFC